MKRFWIYLCEGEKFVGCVEAKDWIDARLEASKVFGYTFGQVFACGEPL